MSYNFSTRRYENSLLRAARFFGQSKPSSSPKPAKQPSTLPGDNNGAVFGSKLPAAASPSAAGQSRAKLGLRYER